MIFILILIDIMTDKNKIKKNNDIERMLVMKVMRRVLEVKGYNWRWDEMLYVYICTSLADSIKLIVLLDELSVLHRLSNWTWLILGLY